MLVFYIMQNNQQTQPSKVRICSLFALY